MTISKAVIVAAGDAKRLRPRTAQLPKCLLNVNGASLISRSVEVLGDHGVSQIIVVVGFLYHRVMAHLGLEATYVHNPLFRTTNNMTSLWLARHVVGEEPFLYLHGDLFYDARLIGQCMEAPGEIALLTDPASRDEEAMKVRAEGARFIESSKSISSDDAYGEWTGIARFSAAGAKAMFAAIGELLAAGRFMDYDTAAFTRLASTGLPIRVCSTNGLPWIEIDVEADYARALKMAETMTDSRQCAGE